MKEIKLGSICLTKIDKTFDSSEGKFIIKKETIVTICDDDSINKGYVLVETKDCPIVLDYLLTELILIK